MEANFSKKQEQQEETDVAAWIEIRVRALGGKLHDFNCNSQEKQQQECQQQQQQQAVAAANTFRMLKRRALVGLLNLVSKILLKPVGLAIAALIVAKLLIDNVKSNPKKVLQIALNAMFLDLILKKLFQTVKDEHTSKHKTKPGVFFCKKENKLEPIVKDIKEHLDYESPSFIFNGHWRTILTSVFKKTTSVSYFRTTFESKTGESHGICLDWSFPSPDIVSIQQLKDCPLVVILAGVGGDSDAHYVKGMCATINKKGWVAVVLGPRGLGNTIPVENLENVFDPCNLSDVLATVDLVHKVGFDTVFLLGYSMGGIMVCNLLGRHAEELKKHNIIGAAAVSGAFKCDMINCPRYTSTYQPVIVPGLLRQLFEKYGEQIHEQFEEKDLQKLIYSSTYQELFENFFQKISSPQRDYMAWKREQEGDIYRSNIEIPLLLVSASEDPLHHPDLIGFEYENFSSPYVLYVLTRHGGHVAWPTKSSSSPSSDDNSNDDHGWMDNLVSKYFERLLVEN